MIYVFIIIHTIVINYQLCFIMIIIPRDPITFLRMVTKPKYLAEEVIGSLRYCYSYVSWTGSTIMKTLLHEKISPKDLTGIVPWWCRVSPFLWGCFKWLWQTPEYGFQYVPNIDHLTDPKSNQTYPTICIFFGEQLNDQRCFSLQDYFSLCEFFICYILKLDDLWKSHMFDEEETVFKLW